MNNNENLYNNRNHVNSNYDSKNINNNNNDNNNNDKKNNDSNDENDKSIDNNNNKNNDNNNNKNYLNYKLQSSGRISHSYEFIKNVSINSKFTIIKISKAVPRYDRGVPVQGYLVVLKKEKKENKETANT